MRSTLLFLALPILLSAAPASRTVEITEVGKQPVESDFSSGGSLDMDLCSSGVKIRGTDKNRIRVSYDTTGDPGQVKVRLRITGNDAKVEVEGCPHDNFRITLEVPRQADLRVRMWAGQLEVERITGNKDLELHAGELDVEVGKVEDYARVDASVLTGEVEAAAFEVSKGGLFRSFEKTGPGMYRLHAHVGAGQVTLQ